MLLNQYKYRLLMNLQHPKMKKRNPFAVVLLSIITFGIYDLYWLVKTKAVLNEKTRSHTPTIWLLILPYLILIVGYIILFTSAFLTAASTGAGEQLNIKGTRRPPQYLHICNTAGGIQYVSQGSPKCLGNDSYQSDYSPSVAGTVYSSPCKTTSGTVRYIYISTSESCPTGTTLIFYNNFSSSPVTGNIPNNSSSTNSTADTSSSAAHPGLALLALGMIIVGFIATSIASIFWFFRFSKAVEEYTHGKMSTAISFLILWLIHLIGVALIQDAFNDTEENGPLPSQPVPAAAAPAAPAPVAPPPVTPPTVSAQPAVPLPPAPSQATGPSQPDVQKDLDNNSSDPS